MRIIKALWLKKGLIFSLLFWGLNLSYSTAQATVYQRVISLSPGTTELVASAGGLSKLVGVVSYSNFPPAVKSLPIVGSYNALNFEKIITLKPDLVIVWKTGNRLQDIERLKQLGQQRHFKIFYSNPATLQDIPKEIKQLGQFLNTQKQANQEANALTNILKQTQQKYQNARKIRYFYQIWNAPMMTINGKQFISQGLELCGGKNIYADLKPLAGEVNLESIITRNPQVILLGGEKNMQKNWLKYWQKYPFITAVKQHQIDLVNADKLQRPTARLIRYLPKVCKQLNQARQ